MTQGMFAAVSGVRANLTRLNVISNNIANINTIGFKSSSVNFGTVFSQTLFGGSRPTTSLGGVNPRQVGVGTQVVDITTNFAQGGAQFTGKATDLYINGNGYFVIEKGDASANQSTGFLFSRAGNFNLDSDGNLVSNPDGLKVRGTSQLAGASPLTTLSVQIPPELTIVKDLNASGQTIATHFGVVENSAAFDAQVTAAGAATGAVTQSRQVVRLQSFSIGPEGSINATYSNGDRITVRSNASTVNAATLAGDPTLARREIIHMPAEGGTFPGRNWVSTDNPFGAAGPPVGYQIGYTSQLVGFEVFDAPAGGIALEGMQLQLQTATVSNNFGLLQEGANTFNVSANTGDTFFGIPSTENRGTLQSGALEASNVDLASEFSTMIITQRGLEANSKVIRTNDEVLQAIINIL
jgi:flagellar hook protein FlgE